MSDIAFHVATVAGIGYFIWLGLELGAGWATIAFVPYGFLASMIVWMITAAVLCAVGRALAAHMPPWAAIGAQAALVPPLVLAFAYFCGGI
jgi:hypothetical protein